MAIAARCETCQAEEAAATPTALHEFLSRHRDPDRCAERVAAGVRLSRWIVAQLPRTA